MLCTGVQANCPKRLCIAGWLLRWVATHFPDKALIPQREAHRRLQRVMYGLVDSHKAALAADRAGKGAAGTLQCASQRSIWVELLSWGALQALALGLPMVMQPPMGTATGP